MGRNGSLVNLGPYDRTAFPASVCGEDLEAGDLVGRRVDPNDSNIIKWFKAFAGTTGTYTIDGASVACVQLAAEAIALKDMKAGAWEGYWTDARIGAKPTADTNHQLYQMKATDDVYLSATRPGAMTKTKPTGTGKLLQKVGDAYCTKIYPTATDYADGILVRIREAAVLA